MAAETDDTDNGMKEMTGEELPATGVESRPLLITGTALIIAGLLLAAASHLVTAASASPSNP